LGDAVANSVARKCASYADSGASFVENRDEDSEWAPRRRIIVPPPWPSAANHQASATPCSCYCLLSETQTWESSTHPSSRPSSSPHIIYIIVPVVRVLAVVTEARGAYQTPHSRRPAAARSCPQPLAFSPATPSRKRAVDVSERRRLHRRADWRTAPPSPPERTLREFEVSFKTENP
jgi:hypothetical protein